MGIKHLVSMNRTAPPVAGLVTDRLPTMAELSRSDRRSVRATAATDLLLRTAAATMVAGALVPEMLNQRALAFDREQLDFYAGLGAVGDASLSFPTPTEAVQVRRTGRGSRIATRVTHGHVEHLSFESPFVPINPAMREKWSRQRRNRIAHAQHWSHHDGPRPTLVVIHGFFASPHLVNGAFFSLPWFFQAGFDVLLYTLPFHGARREARAPFSGSDYFAQGQAGFAESMGQAIHDLRLFLDEIERTTDGPIGVTGLSLGGYTSALLSAVDPRLRVVVPNVPVTDPARLLRSWAPAGQLASAATHWGGPSIEAISSAGRYHSPLNYPSLVPHNARLIIAGLGDRLAPPEQSELLWEHWDRCQLYWFPGSHILHVSQRGYKRHMARFMRTAGFAPPEWRTG